MCHARVSASVLRFPIDGGLLLLDTSAKSLFAFNDAAGHVWDLVVAARSDDDVVNEFATRWDIPVAQARADVSAILAQWRNLGLIGDRDQAETPRPSSTPDRSTAPPSRSATEWTCTIRGRSIAFAVGDQFAAPIHSLFKHLETPGAPPQARLEINTATGGELLLIEDGIERIRCNDAGQLIGALHQALLERIYPGVAWLGLIHGGALARGGAGIGLIGPSGSGKSTLAAGLLCAEFDYLADDLIALSAPDGAIMPWPLPRSIKPGSLDVVAAHHPDLARATPYCTKGLDARLLVPPASAWESEPVRLRTLLFPRFTAGAAADLQQIALIDVVGRLLGDRIWIGYPINEQRVTALLAWLSDTAAYAMTYGDLDDGVRLVERVVG
jgi:hypothetical protein